MLQNNQNLINAYYLTPMEHPFYPAYPWPYYVVQAYPSDPRWGPNYIPNGQPTWPSPPLAPFDLENDEDRREKQQPLTFVLIHGSWADSSFWDCIAAELRKKGHTVHTPEYPGHGSDPNKAVTHAMITKAIADFITSKNLHDVVLVGHSFGGSLIQKVAELLPDRIKRLVFLNAFVLNDGQMVADELPPPAREAFQQLRQSSKDDTIMLYKQISPEPAKLFYEKLDLKKFYTLNIPKSDLYLTDDNVLPLGNNEYGWHPHMSGRLGLFRFIQGHGDHTSTAKTEPAKLAKKIYAAGRD